MSALADNLSNRPDLFGESAALGGGVFVSSPASFNDPQFRSHVWLGVGEF